MAKRLMYIILWPSVLLTTVFGWVMIIKNPALLELDWMKVKLVLVTLLIFYVVVCQYFLNQMQNGIRQDCIERPNNSTTSFHTKIMGESP